MVTVLLIVLFVVFLDPTKIAKLASSFLMLLFAFNCISVIVMRESRIESYDPGFRAPWYPWLQIVGVIGPLSLILVMGWLSILFTGGLIFVGALWYFYYARKRVTRRGAIFHLFARLGTLQYDELDRELRGILKEKGLRAKDPYDEIVARAAILDEPELTSFEQLTHKASEQLANHLPLSAEELANRFMKGTRGGATPTAKGVALPHMRLAGLAKAIMVVARTNAGIRIEVDGDSVSHMSEDDIFAVVYLVSPEEDAALHLRILAQVAQCADDETFMKQWRGAKDKQVLRRMLMDDDRVMLVELAEHRPGHGLIGQFVGKLNLPTDCLLVTIARGDDEIEPRDDQDLQAGDRLTFIGSPENIEQLKDRFGLGDQGASTQMYG